MTLCRTPKWESIRTIKRRVYLQGYVRTLFQVPDLINDSMCASGSAFCFGMLRDDQTGSNLQCLHMMHTSKYVDMAPIVRSLIQVSQGEFQAFGQYIARCKIHSAPINGFYLFPIPQGSCPMMKTSMNSVRSRLQVCMSEWFNRTGKQRLSEWSAPVLAFSEPSLQTESMIGIHILPTSI